MQLCSSYNCEPICSEPDAKLINGMLDIKSAKSLKKYNSFGVDVQAERWLELNQVEELSELIKWNKANNQFPILILGGGSNILFTQDYQGLVVKNNLKGIELVAEDEEQVLIRAYGGENWHEFVLWCLENNYYGIENLSLIPGTVGAAPIQNIGAYGVELKDVFNRLSAVHLETGELHSFDYADCQFAYRNSVFKQKLKHKYCIVEVVLRLSKTARSNTRYGAIQTILKERGIENPSPKAVSRAVIHIRQQKLPDPKKIGNAGSFFKNPIISERQYEKLKQDFPYLPSYATKNEQIKLPAAWLIEQANWKGKRFGDAGVHQEHALVLVNYGKAEGKSIKNLALDIAYDIERRFGILLTPEVDIL